MVAVAETATETARTRSRWPLRYLLWLPLAAVLLPLVSEAYHVMFGANFHIVLPGRVYRCAQPSVAALDSMIQERGIRTVVNLRGTCDPVDWYLDEAQTVHRHNICLVDINFSAGRLPSVSEMRQLVHVLERTEYPILLHCRRGADRTGMAAAVALFLTSDTPLSEARNQLGWRFGHVALGRTAQLDQFLDFYEEWLTTTGLSHSKNTFRDWVMDHYRPGACWSELALKKPMPSQVSATQFTALRVNAHNTSLQSWRLSPQSTAGVHIGCFIYDEQDRLIDVIKSGFRDEVVQPNETTEFTVALPPLGKPGRYRLMVDMVDEQQCWFYQTGSQPLEVELTVVE
jgi:hypothetical protein